VFIPAAQVATEITRSGWCPPGRPAV